MNMSKVEQVVAALGTGGTLDSRHWRLIAFRYAHKTSMNRKVSVEYRERARAAAVAIWEYTGRQSAAAA